MSPAVSVVIPAFNAAPWIAEAIDSVLQQTFRDFEVIVVDDGSTDDTARVASRYGPPVRCLHQANGGVSRARNRGIAESRGRHVAFLDADDAWLPAKLERQMAAMEGHRESLVSHMAFVSIGPAPGQREVRRSRFRGPALPALLVGGNVVGSIGGVVCDRDLFAATGGFDPDLSQCADWDMWIRLATLTEFLYVDEPLVIYRQHAANMSRNVPLLERDSLRVLDKAFALASVEDALQGQRRRAYGRNYRVLAGSYFRAGRYRDFARCAWHAVRLDPAQVVYFLGFPARLSRRLARKLQRGRGTVGR